MTYARIGTISVDQFIAAAPAKVWRALTEPELHARWWAPGDVAEQVGHEFHLQRSRSNASCARSTRTGS